MKFDYVIQNPPYNPKAIWSKFVELGMDLVKEDGKMIVIHPATWRESTKYKKLADKIKNGISELHQKSYTAFIDNKIDIKTDWYVWQKGYNDKQYVIYLDGTAALIDLKKETQILSIPPNNIAFKILEKVTSKKNNGCISLIYNNNIEHKTDGIYKQCGGINKTLSWIDDDYALTTEPTLYQFENKVIAAYAGKPRAKYFSKEDKVGLGLGYIWLTNNKSLPILINSKMLWKIMFSIIHPEGTKRHKGGLGILHLPVWILQSLNFEGLTATTEQELYEHYGLTQEEIEWCEN